VGPYGLLLSSTKAAGGQISVFWSALLP